MTTQRHNLTTIDGTLDCLCSCGARVTAKSEDEAVRLMHAHRANPFVAAPVLLAFVRMAAPVVVEEPDVDTVLVW